MCPISSLMSGSPCKTCRAIRPPHADQPAEGKPRRAPDPYRRTILACTRPIPVGHAVELATAQPPPHDDGQVQTDASAGPAPPAPASSTRLRLRQTTSRAWTQRATTPTPAIPAVRLPAPPPRSRISLRPDTADAATHKHRTPTPGADTGHLDAQTPAPDTGHRSRGQASADTGHRTLAEDVDRLTKARPASDLLGHHAERPRAGTPNRVLVDGACGARQPMQARRRGRPPARDSVSPAVAWSLRWGPAAPRRTAVLGRFRVESRARRGPSSVMAVLR
jgi:hypothetical protein